MLLLHDVSLTVSVDPGTQNMEPEMPRRRRNIPDWLMAATRSIFRSHCLVTWDLWISFGCGKQFVAQCGDHRVDTETCNYRAKMWRVLPRMWTSSRRVNVLTAGKIVQSGSVGANTKIFFNSLYFTRVFLFSGNFWLCQPTFTQKYLCFMFVIVKTFGSSVTAVLH